MTAPRVRAGLSRTELVRAPNLAWNAFVDLLTTAAHDELSTEQRAAHLVFWYDREVQNGGHAAYFANRGVSKLDETVAVLRQLGGEAQTDVLTDAGGVWTKLASEGASERAAGSLDEELDARDRAFHACEPDVPTLLHAHLEENRDRFIELLDP